MLSVATDTSETQEKQVKKKTGKKGKGLAFVERDFCDLLEGIRLPGLKQFADFPHKFEVIRERAIDGPIIIEIKSNTAEIVDTDYIAGRLRHYVQYFFGKEKKWNVQLHVCKQFAHAWSIIYTHREKLPRAVGFLSDEELCLHRLPFDLQKVDRNLLNQHAPMFTDYLDRMTNADAFCARVGSIFDPRAHRKQAVWLRGEKDSGKSRLIEMLALLVGKNSFAVLSPENLDDKFWKSALVGKRLMLVEEADPKFIRSEKFKAITGSKLHTVRPVGGKPYQTTLEPIVFFATNNDADIPNDKAIFERLILCNIETLKKQRYRDDEVLEKLKNELPFITGYCISKWNEVTPGYDIPCEREALQTMADSFEGHYLDFVENYLELQPQGQSQSIYAEVTHVQKLMIHAEIRSAQAQAICKRVILSNKSVRISRITIPASGGKRLNCYVGLRIRMEHQDLLKFLLSRSTGYGNTPSSSFQQNYSNSSR